METEILFFKEHFINGYDIEIIFHKDYTYIFNETAEYPVVKFTLINVDDFSDKMFDDIDYYNDGLTIDIDNKNKQAVFCTTDMGGVQVKIFCDEVVRNDLKYRESDLIDIIKSAKRESDDINDRLTLSNNKINNLTNSLKHDLNIIETKL